MGDLAERAVLPSGEDATGEDATGEDATGEDATGGKAMAATGTFFSNPRL